MCKQLFDGFNNSDVELDESEDERHKVVEEDHK